MLLNFQHVAPLRRGVVIDGEGGEVEDFNYDKSYDLKQYIKKLNGGQKVNFADFEYLTCAVWEIGDEHNNKVEVNLYCSACVEHD